MPAKDEEGDQKAATLPLNFGKRLAHTDKTVRDKGFKVLKLWLKKHPELERLDYMKLWKGLYFGMWMSDKRPVQQELSVNIAMLINDIPPEKQALWLDTFWETMAEAWENLDKHRLNKYLLFMRIVIAEAFKVIRERGWQRDELREMARTFTRSSSAAGHGPNIHSVGLMMQFTMVMWDELKPQLDEGPEVNPDVLMELLEPFLEMSVYTLNPGLVKHIHDFILRKATGGLAKTIASRAVAAATRDHVPSLNREALRATAAALGVNGADAEALAEAERQAAEWRPDHKRILVVRGDFKRVIKRKVKPRKLGKKVPGLAEGDASPSQAAAAGAPEKTKKKRKTTSGDGGGEVMSPLMLPAPAMKDKRKGKARENPKIGRSKAKAKGKTKPEVETLTKAQVAGRSAAAVKRKRKNRATKEARSTSTKKRRAVGGR